MENTSNGTGLSPIVLYDEVCNTDMGKSKEYEAQCLDIWKEVKFVNFDISQFDSYREDNRREVKKAKGGLPLSFGKLIRLLPTAMAESLFLG